MSDFLTLKRSVCTHCYRCVRSCPVKAIRFSGGQAHIIPEECILCGNCYVSCPRSAREVADSAETVRVLLAGPDPVYASLSPAFFANYGAGIEEMRRVLKLLGFADAEEAAIGATMVKREYERILHEEQPDVLLSSSCHSVNLLIQKYHPACLPYLAHIQSPMLAHCADIRRRHPGTRTVYIGPCIAAKDEADHYEGITDAVLTFAELSAWLKRAGLMPRPTAQSTPKSRARSFPTAGGILRSMHCSEPGYTYLAVDGIQNCIRTLNDLEHGQIHRCFIELSACTGSCVGGPVMETDPACLTSASLQTLRYAGPEDFDTEQPHCSELQKSMMAIPTMAHIPSEAEIAAVLQKMGKFTPEDELNCGCCGYASCREKAIAVYQGKAEIAMCLPYLKKRAESFSDNILNSMFSGVVVINDKLEVQQVNRAALQLLNLRDAGNVMGEPVVRILDPKPFLDVLRGERTVDGQLTFLAEYGRYVEMTISSDEENHLLICFLKDVTDAQKERERKEAFSRKTIETADHVVERQMRIVQEIASLLGETAAETKIALTKLKESMTDE